MNTHMHCITPDVLNRLQSAIVECILQGRSQASTEALDETLAGNDFLQMVYEAGVTRGMLKIEAQLKAK